MNSTTPSSNMKEFVKVDPDMRESLNKVTGNKPLMDDIKDILAAKEKAEKSLESETKTMAENPARAIIPSDQLITADELSELTFSALRCESVDNDFEEGVVRWYFGSVVLAAQGIEFNLRWMASEGDDFVPDFDFNDNNFGFSGPTVIDENGNDLDTSDLLDLLRDIAGKTNWQDTASASFKTPLNRLELETEGLVKSHLCGGMIHNNWFIEAWLQDEDHYKLVRYHTDAAGRFETSQGVDAKTISISDYEALPSDPTGFLRYDAVSQLLDQER